MFFPISPDYYDKARSSIISYSSKDIKNRKPCVIKPFGFPLYGDRIISSKKLANPYGPWNLEGTTSTDASLNCHQLRKGLKVLSCGKEH